VLPPTPWKTAITSTMAEVALDANVIVALLYDGDTYHERAKKLRTELKAAGHAIAILDFLLHEAVSVLCRRARERKTNPPDLRAALGVVQTWIDSGGVRCAGRESERLAREALDAVRESRGVRFQLRLRPSVLLRKVAVLSPLAALGPSAL
jgi:predicted nucleic acid-binding protein